MTRAKAKGDGPARHVYEFDNGDTDWIVAESEEHAQRIYRKLFGGRAPKASCRQVPDCKPLTMRASGEDGAASPTETRLAAQWAADVEAGLLGSTVI